MGRIATAVRACGRPPSDNMVNGAPMAEHTIEEDAMISGPIAAPALSYSYRPSLLGAEWNLTLAPDGLAWSAGPRSGFPSYAAISRLRMAYRPMSLQLTRIKTAIRA